jgi:hypothetical protein
MSDRKCICGADFTSSRADSFKRHLKSCVIHKKYSLEEPKSDKAKATEIVDSKTFWEPIKNNSGGVMFVKNKYGNFQMKDMDYVILPLEYVSLDVAEGNTLLSDSDISFCKRMKKLHMDNLGERVVLEMKDLEVCRRLKSIGIDHPKNMIFVTKIEMDYVNRMRDVGFTYPICGTQHPGGDIISLTEDQIIHCKKINFVEIIRNYSIKVSTDDICPTTPDDGFPSADGMDTDKSPLGRGNNSRCYRCGGDISKLDIIELLTHNLRCKCPSTRAHFLPCYDERILSKTFTPDIIEQIEKNIMEGIEHLDKSSSIAEHRKLKSWRKSEANWKEIVENAEGFDDIDDIPIIKAKTPKKKDWNFDNMMLSEPEKHTKIIFAD